jgi:PAS domain S-box-containing protein
MSELEVNRLPKPDHDDLPKRARQLPQFVTQSAEGKTPEEVKDLLLQLQTYHLELEQQHEELRLAQQDASEARARYEDLYNSAPLGYLTLDEQGIIQQLNQRACRYFRSTASQLLARRFLLFVTEDYRNLFQDFFEHTLATDAGQSLKVQLYADDGTIFDARLDALAVEEADGRRACRMTLADITPLQQAIRQRKERQAALDRALTATQLGVWEWSFADNLLTWDHRAQACFGRAFEPNPVSFSVLAGAVHPDDLPSVQQALQQCVKQGKELDLTHRVVWPDGSVHYVAAYGQVQYGPHGIPNCLSGMMRDVTDRQVTQQELEHKNRLLAHVLDNLPVVLGRLSKTGEYLEMVGNGVLRLGISETELLGKSIFDVFPSVAGHFRTLLTGQSVSFVAEVPIGNETFFFQTYGYFDELRQQGIFFSIDITESAQAQNQLRQNQKFIRGLLDHSTDGILSFDQQGCLTAWNQTMEQLTGKREADMLGQLIFSHVPFSADSALGQIIENMLHGTREPRSHLSIALPDRDQQFEVTAIPLPAPPDSTGGGLLLLRNVTERNHLQAQAIEAQLREQRMVLQAVLTTQEEERHRISEALHNGLAQLLYGAKLNLEYQLRHPGTPDKVMQLLEEAIRATRTVSFELTPVVLLDFGLRIALEKLTQHLPPEQLRVQLHLSGLEQPRPHVLDLAIYRITQELLNNIIKHARTREAVLHVAHEDEELYLSAEDSGGGFTPELPNPASKSMGLTTIRNRVTLFGGKMEVVSRPGQGTIVTITIPIKTEYPASAAPLGQQPS